MLPVIFYNQAATIYDYAKLNRNFLMVNLENSLHTLIVVAKKTVNLRNYSMNLQQRCKCYFLKFCLNGLELFLLFIMHNKLRIFWKIPM